MATVFTVPKNNIATTVGSNYTAGSGSLVVASGGGAQFGSPSSGSPLRVTCIRASDNAVVIFKVTGRSTDTLTIASTMESTTDINLVVGDKVEVRVSAGYLSDIHTAVNTLETYAVPGGTTNCIQYNVVGTFAGNSNLTYDGNSFQVTSSSTGVKIKNTGTTGGFLIYGQDQSNSGGDNTNGMSFNIMFNTGTSGVYNRQFAIGASDAVATDPVFRIICFSPTSTGTKFAIMDAVTKDGSTHAPLALGNGQTLSFCSGGVAPPTNTQVYLYNNLATYTAFVIDGASSQSADLTAWRNSAGSVLSSVDKNGAWHPPSMADSSATNGSVYYSTTASRLVFKDSAGTVNNLY